MRRILGTFVRVVSLVAGVLVSAAASSAAWAGSYTISGTAASFGEVSLPSTFSGYVTSAVGTSGGHLNTFTFTSAKSGTFGVSASATFGYGDNHTVRFQVYKGTLDRLAQFDGSGSATVNFTAGQYYTVNVQMISPSYYTTSRYNYTVSIIATTPADDDDGGGTSDIASEHAFTAKTAKSYRSVIYDNGHVTGYTNVVIGVVDVKAAKASKGYSKVTGSFWFIDGTKHPVSGSIATRTTGPSSGTLTVKDLGTLNVSYISPNIMRGDLNGNYKMVYKSTGGKWTGTAHFDGDFDGLEIPNKGEILEDLYPLGEEVVFGGAKVTVAKAGKVSMKKGEICLSGENLSGLKLTYNAKTGFVTGSFNVYSLKDGKLTKTAAKVSGIMVDGTVWGAATIKNAGSWFVFIK